MRSLLAHVSGMQSEPVGPWWERSPGVTVAELLAANDGTGAVFGTGEHYHYSNLGYALLGEAVPGCAATLGRAGRRRGSSTRWGWRRTSYLPQEPYAEGLSVHHLAGTLTPEPLTTPARWHRPASCGARSRTSARSRRSSPPAARP